MYILTVVVMLVGQTTPTLTNHLAPDEKTCKLAASMVIENLTGYDTSMQIVACNPAEGLPK